MQTLLLPTAPAGNLSGTSLHSEFLFGALACYLRFQAPARADVVQSMKNGIVLNLLGMGATILGMQATVGVLVGKALTSSANPSYLGMSPGSSPVLALDVFLGQASANTILSHFLGLVFSLELLRSVTLPASEAIPIQKLV